MARAVARLGRFDVRYAHLFDDADLDLAVAAFGRPPATDTPEITPEGSGPSAGTGQGSGIPAR
jgi:hypothetical protein